MENNELLAVRYRRKGKITEYMLIIPLSLLSLWYYYAYFKIVTIVKKGSTLYYSYYSKEEIPYRYAHPYFMIETGLAIVALLAIITYVSRHYNKKSVETYSGKRLRDLSLNEIKKALKEIDRLRKNHSQD